MGWPTWAVVWYTSLLTVGVVNILAAVAACAYLKTRLVVDPTTRTYQRRVAALALPFVAVCAFRGFFPTIYLFRYAWFNSALCCILLHRSLASIAELCWMGQLALAMAHVANELCLPRAAHVAPRLMICCIGVAELCSFAGTITKNSLYFTFEEGLWVLSGWMCAPVSVLMFYRLRARRLALTAAATDSGNEPSKRSSAENFAAILCVWYLFYCPWGVVSDVPNNAERFVDESNTSPAPWLSFSDGISDAALTRNVTHKLADWGPYLLWMTAYFTLGVWSSIGLAWAPRLHDYSSSGPLETDSPLIHDQLSSGTEPGRQVRKTPMQPEP